MNRKQRRQKEKELGITKFRKGMTRKQKFELIRSNLNEGKKKEKEMEEIRRLQEQNGIDRQASIEIAQEARRIAQEEKIPYIDALKKAQNRH